METQIKRNFLTRIPGWVYILMTLFVLGCAVAVWFTRDALTLGTEYEIASASEVAFGQDGQVLVIDNGKTALLVVNEAGEMTAYHASDSSTAPFDYAYYAAQTTDGSIYLADAKYGERGNLLDRERVVRFRGNKLEVLFEVDYSEWDIQDTPLQYGRIIELQAWGDRVYFLLDAGTALQLKRIEPSGEVKDVAVIPAEGVKNDASYDPATNRAAVLWRSGGMLLWDLETETGETVELPEGAMAYDICVRSGEVYYTEMHERTVRHFSLDTPESNGVFCSFEELPFKLDVSPDGRDVLVTDQVAFYRLPGGENFRYASSEYVQEVTVSFYRQVVLLNAALIILGGLCLLFLLLRLILAVIAAALRSETILRAVLIVVASLIVSSVLAYTMLEKVIITNTTSSEKQVALFSQVLLADIDPDALETLDSPEDYGSEEFNRLKEAMDGHTWESYAAGNYYYYLINRLVDGNVVQIMDFEDTMPCCRPMYPDDPEDNLYAELLHTGETVQTTELSAYGNWSFIVRPIYGSDGSLIAQLDVGQNLDMMQQRQRELTRELIISVVISTIVAAMLMLELTFFISNVQRRRAGQALDDTQKVPLRTLVFLIYMADAMQDAFIAILCRQLYEGNLPIPVGIAIALPMSAQLLTMAVSSLFSGGLVERLGSRAVLIAGMLVDVVGFLICAIVGSYNGLLIGKLLIGAGMGTVYVACNAVAARGGSSQLMTEANADVSSGILAGITIGAGMSSVLLSMGGWRLIYVTGVVILAAGLFIAATSGNVRMDRSAAETGDQFIKARKFFSSRRVIGFFLLVLVPFMMALSYREYFFPLFSQEHGLGEVRIGQIYLLCGLLTLYIGPGLSSWIMKKMGAYWSIVTASFGMGLDMLLFVLFPSLVTVIIGVVLLSLVTSFAYACQYTYFELTPETMLYGEGRAVGVYSLFESLGQTIGPLAYGFLLAFDYHQGIGSFCAVMLILLLVFVVLMRKQGAFYRE